MQRQGLTARHAESFVQHGCPRAPPPPISLPSTRQPSCHVCALPVPSPHVRFPTLKRGHAPAIPRYPLAPRTHGRHRVQLAVARRPFSNMHAAIHPRRGARAARRRSYSPRFWPAPAPAQRGHFLHSTCTVRSRGLPTASGPRRLRLILSLFLSFSAASILVVPFQIPFTGALAAIVRHPLAGSARTLCLLEASRDLYLALGLV